MNQIKKENSMKEIKKEKNIVDDEIDLGRFFELTTSIERYVNSINLDENTNETLEDYIGDFVLIGSMLIEGK